MGMCDGSLKNLEQVRTKRFKQTCVKFIDIKNYNVKYVAISKYGDKKYGFNMLYTKKFWIY